MASIAVFSSMIIFFSASIQALYISLADKLTESPKTEYSLLDPAVPTTPANTIPVAIPMLHLQFK